MAILAKAYVYLGVKKAQQGLLKDAIADWTEAIRLEPTIALAYNNRGRAKLDLGEKRAAIEDFDKAIELDPNDASAYVGRGIAKSDLDEKRAAIVDFDKAIELDPNDALAYVGRGNAKSDLGDKQGAILDYDQAILLDPNFALAYNNRGIAKSDLGEKRAAILDYDQAIDLDPNFAAAYGNRGLAKSDLGEKRAAILDYDQAIRFDSNYALAYYNRGWTFEEIGAIFEAQLDFRRFLFLANKDYFFRATRAVFPHFSTYLAPYLLHRTLQKFTDNFEHFNTVHPIVDATRQQCRPWKTWEEWRRLVGSEKHEPLAHYHALALVNHYMGDPIEAFRLYDEVLDNEETVNVPLNFLGQYYFIESAKLFREPHEKILEFALQQIEDTKKELIARNALRELYYAGQILWANDQPVAAHEYFELADDYLPAAYMQVLCLPAIGADAAEIQAKIADIREREAALSSGEGFRRGFPARPFRLEKPDEDFFAPILHYAHYREIAEAIAEVRPAGAAFEHHEMWTAFRWSEEDLKELDWLIRREELSHLSRQLLAQFKVNVTAQLDGKADAEMILIEKAFNDVIKKDDWEGTKYADFEDFKTKSGAAPDIVQQLARLISDNYRLGAHNKMLLVEYCYLRGDLDIEDAFLMYFYVSKRNPAAPHGDIAQKGLVDGGKEIIKLMLSPVSIAGQVLTAAGAAAITELLKKFSTDSDQAGEIDMEQYRQAASGAKPTEQSDYDRFVDDFLHYLSYEREILGKEKFAQRFPLEGFEDWSKRRQKEKS